MKIYVYDTPTMDDENMIDGKIQTHFIAARGEVGMGLMGSAKPINF